MRAEGKPKATLAAILRAVVEPYLYLDDPWVTDVALATVVANLVGDSDPLWLLLVNPASSGKSEMVQLFRGLNRCAWLAEFTENTLLSGYQREEAGGRRRGRENSLLFRWTDPALRQGRPPVRVILIQDLTGLISARREKRDALLGQLRQVYDGRLVKATGMGEDLVWEGYLGLLGAVTPSYDEVAELNSSLGERFLLYRPLRRDPMAEARKAAAEGVSGGEWRQGAAEVATRMAHRAAEMVADVVIAEEIQEHVIALASLTASGRASVRRDSAKILRTVPEPEGPARLVKQMSKLLVGLCAVRARLEPAEEDLATLAAVARSSIPALRLRVLTALLKSGGSTGALAKRLALPRSTTLYVLEDLQAVGMVERAGGDKEPVWELGEAWRRAAVATCFLVSEEEDPRAVTPRGPGVDTPIHVYSGLVAGEQVSPGNCDSADAGSLAGGLGGPPGGASPGAPPEASLTCLICGQAVARPDFVPHVEEHAREWGLS